MSEQTTFFVINIKYTTVNGEFWVPYGGPNSWQYDWWNTTPAKFASVESAVNAIKADNHFKDCDWQIVKTVTVSDVVIENLQNKVIYS